MNRICGLGGMASGGLCRGSAWGCQWRLPCLPAASRRKNMPPSRLFQTAQVAALPSLVTAWRPGPTRLCMNVEGGFLLPLSIGGSASSAIGPF